jgi:hypothetical protein
MFVKGSTAIEGLCGTAGAAGAAPATCVGAAMRNTCTGLAMFLSSRSPKSSSTISGVPSTKSRTVREM